MMIFRNILIVITLAMILMSIAVIGNNGLNFLTPLITEIYALNWQSHFNLDFIFYLLLSGIWIAWRQGFTGSAIALAILAPPIGMLFFAPYLLYLLTRSGRDMRKLLLGIHA